MDKDIIDLRTALEKAQGAGERESAFSFFGEEERRTRLSVPLWRAIFLLGGDRAGIVWVSEERGATPDPFFVLDLGEEQARTSFSTESLALLLGRKAPCLASAPGAGVAVFLGSHGGRSWHLLVSGPGVTEPDEPKAREELLFLAGECAGLLVLWELLDEAVSPSPSSS